MVWRHCRYGRRTYQRRHLSSRDAVALSHVQVVTLWLWRYVEITHWWRQVNAINHCWRHAAVITLKRRRSQSNCITFCHTGVTFNWRRVHRVTFWRHVVTHVLSRSEQGSELFRFFQHFVWRSKQNYVFAITSVLVSSFDIVYDRCVYLADKVSSMSWPPSSSTCFSCSRLNEALKTYVGECLACYPFRVVAAHAAASATTSSSSLKCALRIEFSKSIFAKRWRDFFSKRFSLIWSWKPPTLGLILGRFYVISVLGMKMFFKL